MMVLLFLFDWFLVIMGIKVYLDVVLWKKWLLLFIIKVLLNDLLGKVV